MLATIVDDCVWFRKLYLPKERDLKARWYLQKLIREARIVPAKTINNRTAGEKFVLEQKSKVMLREWRLSYMLRSRGGLELVKPFFNNRTLDLTTLSPTYCAITERPEEQSDEDLRDLRMFLDFSRIWGQTCRLPGLIKNYLRAYRKKQQNITPTTAVKGYSVGTPRATGVSSAASDTLMDDGKSIAMEGDAAVSALSIQVSLEFDVDEASKLCTQFMNRLLKRRLCIKQNDSYVLEPTFKSRLVLAEAPWILPPISAAPASASARTPSVILGNGPAERPHDEMTARGRAKRQRVRQ